MPRFPAQGRRFNPRPFPLELTVKTLRLCRLDYDPKFHGVSHPNDENQAGFRQNPAQPPDDQQLPATALHVFMPDDG